MKRLTLATVGLALLLVSLTTRAASPIAVMLLDGESGGAYHDWQHVTPVLKKMLDETGLFATTVVTTPPAGGDFSAFAPDFAKYQVVVMNYDAPDERWPAALKSSFETFVTNGGGFVAVHAADNAFPGWTGLQRDGGGRRLARTDRTGGPALVRARRQAGLGPCTRPGRQSRPAHAIPRHRSRQFAPDHEGVTSRVDAPGGRTLRQPARPRPPHDRARRPRSRIPATPAAVWTNRN
jgi:hypothetical protein